MNKNKTNWIMDVILFSIFVIAFWMDLTGMALHQWLGVGIAALTLLHLTLHWKWVVTVTTRFFGRTSNQARLYYLVDFFLLGGLATITLTGLLLSTWLNLPLTSYAFWRSLHVYASVIALAAVVLKIGLHWRWIITTTKKHFTVRLPQPAAQTALQKYNAHTLGQNAAQRRSSQGGVSRREFMQLMSIVGASAFISAFVALKDETTAVQASAAVSDTSTQLSVTDRTNSVETVETETYIEPTAEPTAANIEATAEPTETVAVEPLQVQPVVVESSTSQQSAATCTVRCNKGCSYPGHCRKYTDSNGNNLCDLGECV